MSKISSASQLIKKYGLLGVRVAIERGIELSLRELGKHFNYGQNLLLDDWDILIILDACRYDLFLQAIDGHSVESEINSTDYIYSCASTSKEFMNKCYSTSPNDLLSEIHLITANGWENECVDTSKFFAIEEIWRHHHDDSIGNTPPQPVTDAAIKAQRNSAANRFIIHYLQPHAPFVHCAGKYNSMNKTHGEGNSQNIWEGLQEGRFEKNEIWKDYVTNLELVLGEVEILLDNLDGDVLISADHANAMGEFGIYGHPAYVPVPPLKRVPYVRATATDNQSYDPPQKQVDHERMTGIEDHLQDLGYL